MHMQRLPLQLFQKIADKIIKLNLTFGHFLRPKSACLSATPVFFLL